MIGTAGRLEHAARTSHRPAAYGTQLQRAFARLGVGVGLVAGIVPGILLFRGYPSWRPGERPTPGAAGPVGATAFWLLVGAALWSGAGLELVAVIGGPGRPAALARGREPRLSRGGLGPLPGGPVSPLATVGSAA